MASGAFGTMTYGTGPLGSGAEFALEFKGCIVRGSNEIWIRVEELSGLGVFDEFSELNAKNWNILSLSEDAFPRLIQTIKPVETRAEAIAAGAADLYDIGFFPALRVFTDGPLSANQKYVLNYNGLGSQSCGITALIVESQALERGATNDTGTIEDFKNPQTGRDKLPLGSLGSYNINDQGDIAIDDGSSSLRKRILRRIQTAVSGFYHLPNYGTNLEAKASITPDLARRIKERVKNGVREEPDVLLSTANVYSVRNEEGMVVIQVSATTRFGETITVSEQVRVSG